MSKPLIGSFLLLLASTDTLCKFYCNSGHEITSSQLCDGHSDCEDSSDETKSVCLSTICDPSEFKCFYGACIHRHQVCNGNSDCADGSDESQCGRMHSKSCESTEFRCDSGNCIDAKLICNGKTDCTDNSDESKRICEHILCPPSTFRCRYGSCVHNEAKCNGFYDCIDGSDETIELCSHLNTTCPAIISSRLRLQCESGNGIVPCNHFVKPHTKAVYSCKDYYEPKMKEDTHNNVSVCQENGVWSRNILKCHPECGKMPQVVPLIVNGMNVGTPFPWHATMYVHKNGNWTFWCGASLITEALFISAAHCVFGLSADVVKLALGKVKKAYDADDVGAEFYDAKNIIQHPLYLDQNGNYASDIALIEITGTVLFNEFRMPVCIDWKLDDITSHLSENSIGSVMGMGLNEKEVFSDAMHLTTLKVVPNDKCLETFENDDFKKYVTITSFCAGWLNGTSPCNGDSGGGLVFQKTSEDKWVLEGIVSLSPRRKSSSFCDPFQYTVFTKVGFYIKWIEHVAEEVHATHNFTRKKYEPILNNIQI